MQSVGEESLVHGTRGPATKKECEVSFLVKRLFFVCVIFRCYF